MAQHDGPVRRDRAWVQREYGQEKWPAALQWAREAIDAEPAPAELMRVVSTVARRERARDTAADAPGVVGGVPVRVPAAVLAGAHTELLVSTVLAAVRPDTALVAELGCGWGRNLFHLWAAGGPAGARWLAAEFTVAGQETASLLGTLAPRMDLAVAPCDHAALDLAAHRLDAGHAVVFTSHSIEQVPRLPVSFVDELLALAPEVTVLHLEPVGWQAGAEGDASSRAYAQAHDYNRDLVPLLREAEAAGRLTIEDVRPEVIGLNPHNSTTVVRWTGRRG